MAIDVHKKVVVDGKIEGRIHKALHYGQLSAGGPSKHNPRAPSEWGQAYDVRHKNADGNDVIGKYAQGRVKLAEDTKSLDEANYSQEFLTAAKRAKKEGDMVYHHKQMEKYHDYKSRLHPYSAIESRKHAEKASVHRSEWKKMVNEDAPTVSAGGGQIAGIGVGPSGEPAGKKKTSLMRFKRFVKESLNDYGPTEEKLHADLTAIGVKPSTNMKSIKHVEASYNANHDPKDIHNVLLKHGYKMSTRYRDGGQMPPHTSYTKDAPYGGSNATVSHKDGKVNHLSFNYRKSND